MKKITLLSFLLLAVLVLSGCGTTAPAEIVYSLNTVLKTTDGGTTWKMASEDNTNKTIIIPEILSLELDALDSEKVFAGTEKDGLFFSADGGKGWTKLDFPLTRIFGLAVARGDSKIVYASGLLKERGKIYKSLDEGLTWKEIYSEPANGTVISSLAMSPKSQDTLYAGTSEGMIIKTIDGGKTWKNLTKASGPVTTIGFDRADDSDIYFLVWNNTVLRTKDGGGKFDDLSKNITTGFFDGKPFFLATDPNITGRVYAGMSNGFLGGTKLGDKFEALNVIESSKKFPIRALAVNPQNSNELVYTSAQAIYKSTDGGKTWATTQLDTTRTGSQLKYDPRVSSTIYLGLRKVN
jgi:photosystem II stability/assembly factor-like uncharacterized protein